MNSILTTNLRQKAQSRRKPDDADRNGFECVREKGSLGEVDSPLGENVLNAKSKESILRICKKKTMLFNFSWQASSLSARGRNSAYLPGDERYKNHAVAGSTEFESHKMKAFALFRYSDSADFLILLETPEQ